jgi:hypothetical protein
MAMLLVAATAFAGDAGTLNLQWENDIFAGLGTDRHYTNGMLASWLSAPDRVPDWADRLRRGLPGYPAGGHTHLHLAVAHIFFTPEDIKATEPVPGDWPYAAWLSGVFGLTAVSDEVLESLDLSLGVIGPAAGGEAVQRWVHRVIGSPDPQGWGNQLPNEPVLQLYWERTWRQTGAEGAVDWDMLPHVSIGAGTAHVYGAYGLRARVGRDLKASFGTPRVRPGVAGSEYFAPNRAWGWALHAGAEARVVLHNIFFDGSLFHETPTLDRRPLVLDLQAGADLYWQGLRLSYVWVARSREFAGQQGADRYGLFSLSVRL